MNNEKVKIQVDDQEVFAKPGTPLLQAAIDADIEVPHFCYHPGIGVEGSCRLCLVEVKGMPKMATSCTVPVKEGLVVFTQSDSVKKARKGVLEFFLLHHPLDCPFCDKGGECPLQNFTYDSGQFTTRFEFQKVHRPKHQVIGDHIILDKERCVLCNRCVRFGRDLSGREELQIGSRGSQTEIFIPEGTRLTNGFTGNYADICPVGALTTREFRFRARPWEMKTVNTICGECSLGCNVQAWKKGNELLRLTPRIAPQVNEWWLCDRGRFSIHATPDRERLKFPLKSGKEIEPEEQAKTALIIAEELRKVPGNRVAFVADHAMTNEEFYGLKTLARSIEEARVFVPVQREVKEFLSKKKCKDLFPAFLDQAKFAFILGENIEDDHPVLALRLRRLHHTNGIQVFTAGEANPGLKDVSQGHVLVSSHKVSNFMKSLKSFERSGSLNWDSHGIKDLSKLLRKKEPTYIFLSEKWIHSKTLGDIMEWIEAFSDQRNDNISLSLLTHGTNVRGMIDQWDESVHPLVELEKEIQRGTVDALIWFGKIQASKAFDEYVQGMRLFVHATEKTADAHRLANWALPLDNFVEKSGTYTNTFGLVQTLKKAKHVIQKGFSSFEMISVLNAEFGQSNSYDCERVYHEMAKDLKNYPKSIQEIPEVTKTYMHYERALWG